MRKTLKSICRLVPGAVQSGVRAAVGPIQRPAKKTCVAKIKACTIKLLFQLRKSAPLFLTCAFAVSVPSYAERRALRDLLSNTYLLSASFDLQRGTVKLWEQSDGITKKDGPALLDFNGVLDQEAIDVIGRLLQRRSIGIMSLKSPGGLLEPTLRLGHLVRASKITTIVEEGNGCFSACALLFLAGETRLHGDVSTYEKLIEYSRPVGLGFHAPYIPQKDGTKVYLQDTRSNNVCPYLKSMLPSASAAEVCDYALATRGMASFTYDFGFRLAVFTSRESSITSVPKWNPDYRTRPLGM